MDKPVNLSVCLFELGLVRVSLLTR